MNDEKYLAYLIVRDFHGKEVHRVGVSRLSENYIERVMRGMLINMSGDYYIDDSEVDKARAKADKAATP